MQKTISINKTVGVVIPIYNVQDYLKECLDSVINQTYKNLQVVLVNDGSTDENSLNIAKEYTLKDERFILFDKKNGGLSSSRNVGIEYFSKEYELKNITNDIKENSLIEFSIEGNNPYEIYKVYKSYKFFKNKDELLNFKTPDIDYIIFLDSDDYWELNCIEECVPRMDGVEVVWFDTRILLDGVNYSSWKSNIKWLNYTQECMLERNDWLERLYNYKLAWFYFSWQGMIDFNFLKTIKLKFIDYIIQEDDYFGIVLFSQLKHLYVFPNELYIYRIRPNSIMSYDSKITQKNISTFFQNNLKYFDNDPIRTKKYFHVSSSVKTYLELIKFLKLKRDSLLNKSLCKYLLPTYIKNAYEIIHFSIDPLNLLPNAKTIRKLMKKYNIKPYGIEFRFKNELPYRLGGAILQNCKSFKKIIKLPIRIYEIFNQNKREQKILQMRAMNNSYFELPKLQEYEDCYRLDSLKRHLSYKIGLSFLKHHKYGYFGGYFIFLFKIPVILLKIRKNKKEKEISNIYSEILNLKEHLHDIKTNINNLILQNKNFSFCNIYNNHLLSFFKNENLMEHFFHKSIAFIDLTDRYLENHKILSIFDNIYFYAFELDNFDFLLARKKNLKNIKIFNFILGIETSIKKKTYKLKSDIASQENSCFMQVKDIDWFLDNENFNGCELLILYLRLNSNTFGLLKHIILEKIYLKCFYIFCYIEDNFSHDVLYSEIKQEIKNHNINNIIIRINI